MKYFTKSELAIKKNWQVLWKKYHDGEGYGVSNWEIEAIERVAKINDPNDINRNMKEAIKTGCPSLKYYLNEPMKSNWGDKNEESSYRIWSKESDERYARLVKKAEENLRRK